MKGLQIFTNETFGKIRILIKDREPWFVAADVYGALDISNNRDALSRLDDDEKGIALIDTPGGKQSMTVVNKPGLYSLVLGSRKPEAKEFKRWITHEVIPSIRKHGAYMTENTLKEAVKDPRFAAELFMKLAYEQDKNKALTAQVEAQAKMLETQNKQIEQLEAENMETKPKVDYYSIVLNCQNAIPITIIAKDYGISAQQMNEILEKKGIQYKQSGVWVLMQQYADKGYTKSKKSYYWNGYTHVPSINAQWTQKGRLFIYDELKKDGILPLVELPEGEIPEGYDPFDCVEEEM